MAAAAAAAAQVECGGTRACLQQRDVRIAVRVQHQVSLRVCCATPPTRRTRAHRVQPRAHTRSHSPGSSHSGVALQSTRFSPLAAACACSAATMFLAPRREPAPRVVGGTNSIDSGPRSASCTEAALAAVAASPRLARIAERRAASAVSSSHENTRRSRRSDALPPPPPPAPSSLPGPESAVACDRRCAACAPTSARGCGAHARRAGARQRRRTGSVLTAPLLCCRDASPRGDSPSDARGDAWPGARGDGDRFFRTVSTTLSDCATTHTHARTRMHARTHRRRPHAPRRVTASAGRALTLRGTGGRRRSSSA